MNQSGKKIAFKLSLIQFVLTAFACILAFAIHGTKAMYSSILGGLVIILPNFVMAWCLFRHHGATKARSIVKGFYLGEALKLGLTAFLFAVVFVFISIDPLAFFATAILVVMNYWFAPIILGRS